MIASLDHKELSKDTKLKVVHKEKHEILRDIHRSLKQE